MWEIPPYLKSLTQKLRDSNHTNHKNGKNHTTSSPPDGDCGGGGDGDESKELLVYDSVNNCVMVKKADRVLIDHRYAHITITIT